MLTFKLSSPFGLKYVAEKIADQRLTCGSSILELRKRDPWDLEDFSLGATSEPLASSTAPTPDKSFEGDVFPTLRSLR